LFAREGEKDIKPTHLNELNDVWRVSSGGDAITSLKTRGFAPCCGRDFCVTMPSAGPAMFVAAVPGPTRADVYTALKS